MPLHGNLVPLNVTSWQLMPLHGKLMSLYGNLMPLNVTSWQLYVTLWQLNPTSWQLMPLHGKLMPLYGNLMPLNFIQWCNSGMSFLSMPLSGIGCNSMTSSNHICCPLLFPRLASIYYVSTFFGLYLDIFRQFWTLLDIYDISRHFWIFFGHFWTLLDTFGYFESEQFLHSYESYQFCSSSLHS